MKNIKLFSTLVFLVVFTTTSFAQDKVTAEATKKVEELNKELISVDKNAALTESQQQEIINLYVEKTKAIKKIKKEVSDETEQKNQIKEINKAYGKNVNMNVLTKEQREAKKKAKQQTEE